jgi:hypothetical protein
VLTEIKMADADNTMPRHLILTTEHLWVDTEMHISLLLMVISYHLIGRADPPRSEWSCSAGIPRVSFVAPRA